MKRLFILATAAIVALASCAKTEVVYTDAPEEIAFKQVTNVMTKATALDPKTSLGVVAHQSSTLHFNNTSFNWSTEKSAYVSNSPLYWPREGSLDFTVYAPFNNNATFDLTSKTLTLSSVTAADELYYGVQRYENTTYTEKIAVELNHVSAKITVNFEGNGVFTLTQWTITDVNQTGTVTVDYTDAENPTISTLADPAPTTSTLNSGQSEYYVLPGSVKNISVTFNQGELTYTKDVTLTGNWEAHKHYTYNLNVTAPEQIMFTANVNEWTTESSSPTVPTN